MKNVGIKIAVSCQHRLVGVNLRNNDSVIPAKAGIQNALNRIKIWMPAFAGMTFDYLYGYDKQHIP